MLRVVYVADTRNRSSVQQNALLPIEIPHKIGEKIILRSILRGL